MHERNVKVREGHRSYSLKSDPQGGNPKTPFVLLQGSWLEKAGFSIGLPLRVKVEERRLVITPAT